MDSLLNSAPCGYVSFKDDGTIVEANKTLSGWLGYQQGELEGERIEKIFTIATRIFYNTHLFPLVKLHSKAEEIFMSLRSKTNDDLPVLSNAERIFQDDIYLTHCIFILIRQRKKYEEEILHAKRSAENELKENKYLQELTASLETRTLELDRQLQQQRSINADILQFSKIVSHDLHEPIRKIQFFADVVLSEKAQTLTSKSVAALHKIDNAAERLRTVITGLYEYITVDTDKVYTEIDLNRLVDRAKGKAIDHRKFEDFDFICDDLPFIAGYSAQLELLFYHLIDNAIQFRDPSRRLNINISCTVLDENLYKATSDKYRFTEHLRIVFNDNGIGFDNQYKKYILELLKKVNPSSDGLGIGLPLIRKIIDSHNGSLAIDSEPGNGAVITILLPMKVE